MPVLTHSWADRKGHGQVRTQDLELQSHALLLAFILQNVGYRQSMSNFEDWLLFAKLTGKFQIGQIKSKFHD